MNEETTESAVIPGDAHPKSPIVRWVGLALGGIAIALAAYYGTYAATTTPAPATGRFGGPGGQLAFPPGFTPGNLPGGPLP